MRRYYYHDSLEKRIFVFDTFQDSIDYPLLGTSENPNIKSQVSMFLRGEVGYRILYTPSGQT